MEKIKLQNNISVTIEKAQNHQNVSLCLNFSRPDEEKICGIWELMSTMLQQKMRTLLSEQFLKQLDKNAIELSSKVELDFFSISLSCPKDDFNLAVELLSQGIKNPPPIMISPDEFEKEKNKVREALKAELEDNRTVVFDSYYNNLFEGHYCEKSYTKKIENLDRITKEDVEKAYKQVITKSKKVMSVVGDVDFGQVKMLLNKHFGEIENENPKEKTITASRLKENKIIELIKSDAPKALIVKGWSFPTFNSDDYAALSVLNSILGADGLCSMLFLELRGKQDIVYAIRSSYEAYKTGASFSIYASTDVENIQEVLDGVDLVLNRLKNGGVDEVELGYGKKVLLSKHKKITEDNVALANQLAQDEILGMGFDFQDKTIEKIKKVTSEQIQECAKKYFDDKSVVSILKPETN